MSSAIRLVVAVAGVGVLLWVAGSEPTAEAAPEYAVSGPYTHDNLSVFLLHGPDTLPPRPVKALDEALADGTAVVHETGNVNQLCVENLSADNDLMMQNGDILKGGKQDRVLQVAMILPPKSGRVAVPAFCVEQGRWTGRGQEAVEKFAANPGQIAGKNLKLAVNAAGVQGEVWANVQAQQAALSGQVGKAVNGAASPTSLQLALEDKELQAKLAGYRAALANALAGKKRVVGYAIAVNGKVTGAEVFGSGVLLAKAWPKAIGAAAVEALAEKQDGKTFATATQDTVQVFLADAGRAPPGGAEPMRETTLTLESPALPNLPTPATANPTFGGRSAATRDGLVTGHGGRGQAGWNPTAGGFTSDLNVPARANGDPAQTADTQVFPLEQLGAIVVRARAQPEAARPAIAAPPVNVNRTAGKNGVMVESRDRANPGVVIHRTFIAR